MSEFQKLPARARLAEVRKVAERLNLGACPESRYLRATLIELVSALLGDEVRHPDIHQSGALEPLPDMLPAARPAPAPQAAKPAHAPYVPAAPPAQSLTVEQALAQADARAKLGQSSAVRATATIPNTPPVGSVPIARIVPIREAAAAPSATDVAAAAATTQARPDPTVPDPGGESFLENLAADLDADAESDAG